MAESRSAIGKSGLVTAVGSENGWATRSTRAESGANGMPPRPAASSSACVGCGIGVDADVSQPVEPALETDWPCATVPMPGSSTVASTMATPVFGQPP